MARALLPLVLLASAGLAACGHGEKKHEAGHSAFEQFFSREPAGEPALPPMQKQGAVPSEARNFAPQGSVSRDGSLAYCGELHYGESNRFASDEAEVSYSMRLDCDSSGAVDAKDGRHLAYFPQVKPQQKGWFTRWMQEAAKKHGRFGVAYICFKGQAKQDPCAGTAPVAVEKPSFSSARVDEILRSIRSAKN
jgi:hypothetical protein